MMPPVMTEPTNGANTPSRGIYLLPNLLTTGCLFSGFYSIVAAIDRNFALAGGAIFIALLFDGVDGRVARWTKTESPFGKEYDSLADMVAFGLAPAVLVGGAGGTAIAFFYATAMSDLTVMPFGALLVPVAVYAACLLAAATSLPLLRRTIRPSELRYA